MTDQKTKSEKPKVKAAFVTRAELMTALNSPAGTASAVITRLAAEVFRLRAKLKRVMQPVVGADGATFYEREHRSAMAVLDAAGVSCGREGIVFRIAHVLARMNEAERAVSGAFESMTAAPIPPWVVDGQRVRGIPGTVFYDDAGVLRAAHGTGTWFVMDGSRILTHSTVSHLPAQFVPVFEEGDLHRTAPADGAEIERDADLSAAQRRAADAEAEVARLRQRVTDLTALEARIGAFSSAVDAWKHASVNAQAREFRLAMGQSVGMRPHVPNDKTVRFCTRLVAEEFFELLEASFPPETATLRGLRGAIMQVIDGGAIRINLPELADACGDLDYVVAGLRAAFGIDGGPIAALIHAANMAKVGGPIRESDGKRLKPEGWKPPDVAGELRCQGWIEPSPHGPNPGA